MVWFSVAVKNGPEDNSSFDDRSVKNIDITSSYHKLTIFSVRQLTANRHTRFHPRYCGGLYILNLNFCKYFWWFRNFAPYFGEKQWRPFTNHLVSISVQEGGGYNEKKLRAFRGIKESIRIWSSTKIHFLNKKLLGWYIVDKVLDGEGIDWVRFLEMNNNGVAILWMNLRELVITGHNKLILYVFWLHD